MTSKLCSASRKDKADTLLDSQHSYFFFSSDEESGSGKVLLKRLIQTLVFLSLVAVVLLGITGCQREDLDLSNSTHIRKTSIVDDYQSFNKAFKTEHSGYNHPGYICSVYFSSLIPAGTGEVEVNEALVTRGGGKEISQAPNKKKYSFVKKDGYLSTFVLNVYVQYTSEKKVQSLYCNEGYKSL